MGAHYQRADAGTYGERPTFDEVARGYDPQQVEAYLDTLWRYAGQVTARAAAAEAALESERRRRDAEAQLPDRSPAQAGGRIGIMLAIAQQEADEIVAGARGIAERALQEVVEDSAASHPIVRKAREQADRLLFDAVEQSRLEARQRQADIETQITQLSGSLETLRRQQGEVLGALLRLRSLVNTEEIDRAVTELARAGTAGVGAEERERATAYRPEDVATSAQTVIGSEQKVTDASFTDTSLFARTAKVPGSSSRYRDDEDILDAEVVEE
ncbi:hypothetical protein [Frankia sp. CiP1_Cm_nod2]